jgi:hypothetical protein
MIHNQFTAAAIALLTKKGRIEVNILPKNEARFRRIYRRMTGRNPTRGAYNVAKDPKKKGGDQLRLVVLDDSIEAKELVEKGLGVALGKGPGGKGWRKGDNDLCIDLIAAGLDIGGKRPRVESRKAAITRRLKEMVKEQQEYLEGFKREVTRELRARNRSVVEEAKRRFGVTCVVCGFNFGNFYGPSAHGFIEGHHLEAMATYHGPRKVTASQIRPVCANCHRMLHRGKQLLSIERLKRMIREEGTPVAWPWK